MFTGGDVGGGCTGAISGRTTPGPYPRSHALTATDELCVLASTALPPPPNTLPNQPARPAWAALAEWAPVAAPAPPQPVNTNPNNDKDKENKSKVEGDRPPSPVPSHGTTGNEGSAADRGVVTAKFEEAGGNLQGLWGKVKRWEAKLGRCQELGDVLGGTAAGKKVLEGRCWLRKAQRAVEELEGNLASMGTGDDGVKVHEGGDDNVQPVGVVEHPGGNPVVA